MQKTKHIIAIATLINGQVHYVSGQSVNQANKYIPQYNKDAQEAKQFTSEASAETYLQNVSTQVQRHFNVIQVDIIDKEFEQRQQSAIGRFAIILLIASIVLVSCSVQRDGCPSTNQKILNKANSRPFRA